MNKSFLKFSLALIAAGSLPWAGLAAEINADFAAPSAAPLAQAQSAWNPAAQSSVASTSSPRSGFIPEQNWVWANVTDIAGLSVLGAADLLGDGLPEIIVDDAGRFGQPNASVIVLRNDLESAVCRLELPFGPVLDHRILEPGAGMLPDVLFVSPSHVFVMDGRTCAVTAEHPFPAPVTAAGIGDVNGNGVPDVAYSIAGDLYVAPWNDFSAPVQRPGFGGDKIVVGSLGRAGGDDIVVRSAVLYVLRGDNLSTITEIATDTRDFINLGDVTGDGIGNVVVGAIWTDGVAVFDLVSPEPLLSYPSNNLANVRTADLTGDGRDEIFLMNAQFGGIEVINGDGDFLIQIANDLSFTTNAVLVDLNLDGELDVVLTAGPRLHRANPVSGQLVWSGVQRSGPFQIAPVNPARVAVSFRAGDFSNLVDGGVVLLDRRTGAVVDTIEPPTQPIGSYVVTAIAAGFLGAPASNTVCLSAYSTVFWGSGVIHCVDADSGATRWTRPFDDSLIYFLKAADFDGDGQVDLLTMSFSGDLSLHDGSNGFLKWFSSNPAGEPDQPPWGFNSVVHGDGVIWVLYPAGHLRKLDAVDGSILESDAMTDLTHIAQAGGRVFGIRSGTGVGELDLADPESWVTLYETSENLSLLAASPDGGLLLTATGMQPDLRPLLVSSTGSFTPVWLDEEQIWGVSFSGADELLLATSYGAISLSFDALDRVFRDRFQR